MKPKPKKLFKTSSIVLICLFPFLLLILLCINFFNTKNLLAIGSSGVKPFLEDFLSSYVKQNKKIDFSIETGGSGFGVEQIAKGFANIGDSSTNHYEIVNNSYANQWKKNKIKTVTIGWEALCLVYILPNDLSNQAIQKFEVAINNNNVNQFYANFSGFNELESEPWNDEYNSIYFYMTDNAKEALSIQDVEICKKTKIVPYVRSGGCTTSGTASAFYSESHLKTNLTPNQKKAFEYGTYGTSHLLHQTDEANSRAWDMFYKNKIPGSFVYLSSGFVQNNQELIKKANFKIMSYQDYEKGGEIIPYDYNIDKINKKIKGYNWFRPLNCCFSLDNQDVKKLFSWIFYNNNVSTPTNENWLKFYHDSIAKIGARGLSIDQIKSMCKDINNLKDDNFWQNFWIDDYSLLETREQSQKNIFGALEDYENTKTSN